MPFVPFIISPSLFFPFITGKAFIFRLIVEVIFAAYFVLALRDESYRPKFSWILGSVMVFLVSIGLADIFAENPYKAFWSNFERMEGYITLLHLGAYFLVMSSVLKSQEIWNKLLYTTLFSSLIMSIYSFFQLAGTISINQGGVRVDGTLGNASYLGIYMVFHIFIAALLYFRTKVSWQKWFLVLVSFLNIIVLYHTATRGAILGFLGGALVAFVFLAFKSENGSKMRKTATGGFVALVVFIGLFFALRNTSYVSQSPVLSRFASLSFEEIKNQGRYYVWPMAIKGFIERPILGWGQEGFNFVFNKYYDSRMYNQEPWFDRAHNTFLDWLVAGGLLGFLSYLSILLSLAYYIFKAKEDFLNREDKAVVLGVISAYVFNNFFVFDQISSYILFFTFLAYVHAHNPEVKQSFWDSFSFKLKNFFAREKIRPVLESLALIFLFFVIYFVNFLPWRQNKDLLNVLRLNNQGVIGPIEDYQKPLRDGVGFSESLEHVSQAAVSLNFNPDASSEFKNEIFQLLDGAFIKHIENVPTDARYRLFYGLFLSRFGWYGRASEQLAEASRLSPNKQSIYFEIGNNSLLDNDLPEALEAARVVYELEPSYEEARMFYGLILLSTGQNEKANEIMSGLDENKIIFDQRYIGILASLKQFDKLIEIAKSRVNLDPKNKDYLITLAATYLEAGRRSEAISTLEKVIDLDPNFREMGEYYIREIRAGRTP